MDIIARGAEAVVIRDGNKIIKERIRKGYRIPELDKEIRKIRTQREARLISEARRCGVPTPMIFEVSEFKIVMEYVNGEKVKYVLEKVSAEERKELARQIGMLVGKLHKCGIVHGDLTTSNMILRDGKIYFIDFGLGFFSKRIEDLATDLSVLKESLKATHCKYLYELWENIVKGYLAVFEEGANVLKHLEKIEKRGRYVER
jgi:Kae1-associated kinase Bud32